MDGGSTVVNDGDDALIGLPPGFRFHPTDEEIVTHYLTPKVLNRNFTASAMGEVDLNKSEPWDLPRKAKMGEKEWFFFCNRDRKYPTGLRTNRATESGYWKATGKDKEIFRQEKSAGNLVGMKKTLVFYKGRAPKGEKTNWVMHEFRLEGKFSYYNMSRASKDEWVVCRVFHKNTGIKRSPISDHGINSFVDELLDSPPWLPPLTDLPPPNLDPDRPGSSSDNNNNNNKNNVNWDVGKFKDVVDPRNYPSYFSNDQFQLVQREEDYKNTLVSPYSYNFNTNTYQTSTNLPYFTSGTTISGLPEEGGVLGRCKVEQYFPTANAINQSSRISVSQDTGVSNDMTTEISSSLSKQDMSIRSYGHAGPSTLSELDSLLEY